MATQVDGPKIKYREDGNILVREVRLSYPHLFKPWAKTEVNPETGAPSVKKFSGTFIMPIAEHKATIQSLNKFISESALEQFKKKLPSERYFVRDGRQSGKDEYDNAFTIHTSQTAERPPKVVDRNPKKIITEESNRVYAGCWVNVLFRPWFQNNKSGGQRINANLLLVQFVKDDDAFSDSATPDADDAFDDISGDFDDEGSDPDGDDLDL